MPDKKLTDNEIKKIKKRLKDIVEENELEYFHSNTMGWYPEIRLAYMAIKHLQAENEQYKANSDSRQTNEYKNIDIAHIKAEAYKKVFEKLKDKSIVCKVKLYGKGKFFPCLSAVALHDIKLLEKELVGDK